MKTIVLTGMSGCGKSSVGKALAQKLNIKFVDVDEEIVFLEKKSINDIFAKSGEKYFRELESQQIIKSFTEQNLVIALGGGAFENENTRNFLLNNATVVYLQAGAQTILDRLKNSTNRPLLNNNMNLITIEKLLNSRKNNYELAHFSVITDNKTIEEILGEIIKCVNLK